MYDFRTPRQKAIAARREEAASIFAWLKENSVEGTTDNRIMYGVAEQMGCTRQNVRVLLISAGVIKPRKRAKKN